MLPAEVPADQPHYPADDGERGQPGGHPRERRPLPQPRRAQVGPQPLERLLNGVGRGGYQFVPGGHVLTLARVASSSLQAPCSLPAGQENALKGRLSEFVRS